MQSSAVVYSVSDLNAYVRALLESNENLMDIWVSGEVSNISRPRSGHIYLTLKDENAQVRGVIWRQHAMRMVNTLRDGLLVEAHGAVSVYESGGQYQLSIDGIRAAGEGRLYQEFLRLKATLEAEGLFDEARKRTIPPFPETIGIVTSATGAALQDMLNTLRGQYPLAEVILSPATVQGKAAPISIVDALDRLNKHVYPDVILIGRGGGSLEDLWAFNDEAVVRAVVRSAAPVISGVGHETDFTLTDFAADIRAPTPTGAAVAAVPDITEISQTFSGLRMTLRSIVQRWMNDRQTYIQTQRLRLDRVSPTGLIHQHMQALDHVRMRLDHISENFFLERKRWLELNAEKLTAHDPRSILKQGYAVISDSHGKNISSVRQVQLEENISARVHDGVIESRVQKKRLLKDKKNDKND